MGALKGKRLGKVVRDVSDWIENDQEKLERIEELQTGARIVVKLKRYMRTNGFSQKQLADKLKVSPQYINKLLHGEAADMKISTAVRYGKMLGINLIDIPKDQKQEEMQVIFTTVNVSTYFKPESSYPQLGTYQYSNLSSPLHQKSQNKDQYGKRPS